MNGPTLHHRICYSLNAREYRMTCYTVFTRGDRRGERSHRVNKHATATARATVHATKSHGLNMFNFVRSNVRLSQRLCKLQPITDQRNATQAMASEWTMDKTLKLINIVKNYTVVWQTDHKIIIWSVCHSTG